MAPRRIAIAITPVMISNVLVLISMGNFGKLFYILSSRGSRGVYLVSSLRLEMLLIAALPRFLESESHLIGVLRL
jgi:hypothetical protein